MCRLINEFFKKELNRAYRLVIAKDTKKQKKTKKRKEKEKDLF